MNKLNQSENKTNSLCPGRFMRLRRRNSLSKFLSVSM